MFQQLIHSFPLPPVPRRQTLAPGKSFPEPGRTTFKTPPPLDTSTTALSSYINKMSSLIKG